MNEFGDLLNGLVRENLMSLLRFQREFDRLAAIETVSPACPLSETWQDVVCHSVRNAMLCVWVGLCNWNTRCGRNREWMRLRIWESGSPLEYVTGGNVSDH